MSGSQANQVHNERTKLLAGLLNTMAGSSFTVGIAAPLAAMFFYNPANRASRRLSSVWANVAGFFHLAARHILGGLTA